jgi:hypothetical protein
MGKPGTSVRLLQSLPVFSAVLVAEQLLGPYLLFAVVALACVGQDVTFARAQRELEFHLLQAVSIVANVGHDVLLSEEVV